MKKIDAYWFADSDRLPHGDDRIIQLGETHSVKGEIVICHHGLHASRDPFDALQYAPGVMLYKVRCWGDVIEQHDKLACRHREYVTRIDATTLLRQFAREQASSVLHLWDAPQIVRDYLASGDESLRAAAAAYAARAAAYAAYAAAYAAHAAAYAAYAARAAAYAARAAAYAAARAVADAVARAADAAARKRFNDLGSAALTQ